MISPKEGEADRWVSPKEGEADRWVSPKEGEADRWVSPKEGEADRWVSPKVKKVRLTGGSIIWLWVLQASVTMGSTRWRLLRAGAVRRSTTF